MFVLVSGGSGSGKSAYAEARVSEFETREKYYIATMQIYGEEGKKKVKRHQDMRAGRGFKTIERQRDIQLALSQMKAPKESCILLECMSNLVANEMFFEDKVLPKEQVVEKICAGLKEVIDGTGQQVIVTNNVFEDGVQYSRETMDYMWALGQINLFLAGLADEVIESVVGIPVRVK